MKELSSILRPREVMGRVFIRHTIFFVEAAKGGLKTVHLVHFQSKYLL